MDENKVARFRPVLSGFASRVAGLGIIEICGMCGNRTQGAVLCFNAGEVCQSQESESEAKCTCVSTQKIRWSGRAWDAPRGDNSRLYLSLPQKADKVHKWRWVTAWLCFMRRAAAKRAETCCHWSNIALHFHRCLSVRQPLLLPSRQPRLLCCNWTRDPGTRDPRPPFLCEVASAAGPVISRTWNSQQ